MNEGVLSCPLGAANSWGRETSLMDSQKGKGGNEDKQISRVRASAARSGGRCTGGDVASYAANRCAWGVPRGRVGEKG